MMYLSEVLPIIKESKLFNHYYVGRIDKSKDKAVCIYPLTNQTSRRICIGGKALNGYAVKGISILVQATSNSDVSEKLAHQLYSYLDELVCDQIGTHEVYFIELLQDTPINVTESGGSIFEYVIEVNIYYK